MERKTSLQKSKTLTASLPLLTEGECFKSRPPTTTGTTIELTSNARIELSKGEKTTPKTPASHSTARPLASSSLALTKRNNAAENLDHAPPKEKINCQNFKWSGLTLGRQTEQTRRDPEGRRCNRCESFTDPDVARLGVCQLRP